MRSRFIGLAATAAAATRVATAPRATSAAGEQFVLISHASDGDSRWK